MEPAMEIFRGGRGHGCYCGDHGNGQGLVGFTSEQLVSEGEIWIKENTHTHGWMFRNALHNTCSQMHQYEHTDTHCTQMEIHTCIHTDTHLHTQFLTDPSPYRSFPPLLLFFIISILLRSPYLTPPSLRPSLCCFFLQGLCFPLPTVMLISAVIRREGLNAAF